MFVDANVAIQLIAEQVFSVQCFRVNKNNSKEFFKQSLELSMEDATLDTLHVVKCVSGTGRIEILPYNFNTPPELSRVVAENKTGNLEIVELINSVYAVFSPNAYKENEPLLAWNKSKTIIGTAIILKLDEKKEKVLGMTKKETFTALKTLHFSSQLEEVWFYLHL